MCRYFVTSCLYNPSLYHIVALCLRAHGLLGTSPPCTGRPCSSATRSIWYLASSFPTTRLNPQICWMDKNFAEPLSNHTIDMCSKAMHMGNLISWRLSQRGLSEICQCYWQTIKERTTFESLTNAYIGPHTEVSEKVRCWPIHQNFVVTCALLYADWACSAADSNSFEVILGGELQGGQA